MSFFKKLFQKDITAKKGNSEDSKEHEVVDGSDLSAYEKAGLDMPIDAGEEEIVKVIAASIFAENRLDTKMRIKKIIKIDPELEGVAVITAALAAENYPNSQMKLHRIEKIDEERKIEDVEEI